jgi:SAM-dependent methyltransferase
MVTATARTRYEQRQDFNRLTRYLRSDRYKALLELVGELQAKIGHRSIKALEIGCGPGTAVGPLLERFAVDYTGIDNSEELLGAARRYHGHRPRCRFVQADASDPAHYQPGSADIVFALETLEHIPEGQVVRIVERVCRVVRPHLFVASVPVEVGPALWIKNWGSALMGYDRRSGDLRQTFWAGLYRLDLVPTHDVMHLGFDWRWLAQTIRHNAPMREIRSLPFSFLPKSLTPSVLMVAEPRGPVESAAK